MSDTNKPSIRDPFINHETATALYGLLTELSFVILPLIVLALMSIHKGDGIWKFMSAREISFAAAIFFGQALVKFAGGISLSGVYTWELFGLLVALIIVLGLVPAMIMLALLMSNDPPPAWVVWGQDFYLVLSIVSFLSFGAIGQILIRRGSSKK